MTTHEDPTNGLPAEAGETEAAQVEREMIEVAARWARLQSGRTSWRTWEWLRGIHAAVLKETD